jgi:uncharacterized LabA/DUF88 family protein
MISYILIDGENFAHKIVSVLVMQKVIRDRQKLKRIEVGQLFDKDIFENSIKNYYATIIRLPKRNHPLYKKVEEIRAWNHFWVPYIANQNINYIKAGYLRIRDGKKCIKCGAKTEVLSEKGVDVRMAVDIVNLARKNTRIFVVSSDTDLVPAIIAAKQRSAEVIYVAFKDQEVKLLEKTASKTIFIKNSQVKKAYKEANK